MRLLFTGSGYPGVEGARSGTGIGTYLREICLGLGERGHECHVLVWRDTPAGGRIGSGNLGLESRQGKSGVTVHLLPHTYWPVVERVFPDSRDVEALRHAVRILDNRHRFDWIEIQSEEGIGIGIQKRFPRRTILRIHTTLAQMIDHREIELTRASALRLRREKESFRSAERVVTHSERHASELRRLPDLRGPVHVVRHGIGDLRFEREADPAHDPVVDDGAPTFLVVGTPDRRKGFDRIAPVLAAYAGKHGPCKCVVVSTQDSSAGKPFGLGRGMPPGVELRWLNTLSGKDYVALYGEASALLALARYESFGFPLIEAACLSVPVVTTDVGIASELLTNSLSRFIVDGDSPEICADALHRAVRRKDTVGRDLRLKYETQFTREKMAGDYEAYLRLPEG